MTVLVLYSESSVQHKDDIEECNDYNHVHSILPFLEH